MRRRSLLKALCALPFVPKVLAEPKKLTGIDRERLERGEWVVPIDPHAKYREMLEQRMDEFRRDEYEALDRWIWDEPRPGTFAWRSPQRFDR